MRSLLFYGLLLNFLNFGCVSNLEGPSNQSPAKDISTPVTPETPVTRIETPLVSESGPPLTKPAPSTTYATYRVETDPPGVGVLREGGELIGLTPLVVTLDSARAFRLTFLKKGFQIFSRFIVPEAGDHLLKLTMEPERP